MMSFTATLPLSRFQHSAGARSGLLTRRPRRAVSGAPLTDSMPYRLPARPKAPNTLRQNWGITVGSDGRTRLEARWRNDA